ncbi:hypothetical protein ACFVUW_10255 [Streptomyces xiamenensis]|uniref:hypothetical protein n=1 Tax=Streptomyces xiamenensis TaxID=408015 RepID=UPI0036E9B5CA
MIIVIWFGILVGTILENRHLRIRPPGEIWAQFVDSMSLAMEEAGGIGAAVLIMQIPIAVVTLAMVASLFSVGPFYAAYKIMSGRGIFDSPGVTVNNRYGIVFACARLVRDCAAARALPNNRRPDQYFVISESLAHLERWVSSAHRDWGSSGRKSHLRHDLRTHSGQVIAALRRAESGLHVSPDRALREISDTALTISERYTEGRIGALLPEEEIEGLLPVQRKETLRLVVAVFVAACATTGVALLGLPSAAEPYALGATAMIALSLTYGRRHRRVVDLLDTLRGLRQE